MGRRGGRYREEGVVGEGMRRRGRGMGRGEGYG